MKKLHIYLLASALILNFSCKKFLTETPPNFISSKIFYKTENDARTVCDGVYKMLYDGSSNSIYGRWWPAIDLGTDDATSRTAATNFNTWFSHTINPSVNWLETWNQYSSFWVGIARANSVIDNVPQIPMDEIRKNAIIGEARALRALFYFHLVRTYGDVPLITTESKDNDSYKKERSAVDVVYDQVIIPDLQYAEQNCRDGLHDGHVTKWTAKIILADVYLTRAGWRRNAKDGALVQGDAKNWALARDKAKEIIDLSPNSLITTPTVRGLNTIPACGVAWDTNAPFSSESLLEVSAVNQAGFGSWLTRECLANATGTSFWGAATDKPLLAEGINKTVNEMQFPGKPFVSGFYIPTPDLYRSFEAGDQRKDWAIMTRYTTQDGQTYLCQPTFRRYVDIDYFLGKPNTAFENTNNNFLLYRYADALLIYAEAANEVGPAIAGDAAYNAVDRIRNRAGLANLTTGLSQDQFRQAVWKERRSEFCGECKRRFDLIRTKRLATETALIEVDWLPADNPKGGTAYVNRNPLFTGKVAWPDREWLMPLPFSEIKLNEKQNWYQNFGY